MAHANFLQAQSQVTHVHHCCVHFLRLYQKLHIKHGYKNQNNFLRFWSFPSWHQALNSNLIHRRWLSSYRLVFIDVILQGEKEEDTCFQKEINFFSSSPKYLEAGYFVLGSVCRGWPQNVRRYLIHEWIIFCLTSLLPFLSWLEDSKRRKPHLALSSQDLTFPKWGTNHKSRSLFCLNTWPTLIAYLMGLISTPYLKILKSWHLSVDNPENSKFNLVSSSLIIQNTTYLTLGY